MLIVARLEKPRSGSRPSIHLAGRTVNSAKNLQWATGATGASWIHIEGQKTFHCVL